MESNNMESSTSEVKETPAKKPTWDELYGKKGKKKKKVKPGVVIAIVAAILLLVAGGIVFVYRAYKNAMENVQSALGDGTVVEEYGKKDMSAYIDVTGVVETQEVENVITDLQYPVEEIKVEVGDHVKKGDVLCVIDSDDIQEKIEDLEAQASDAERIKAKELETARHNLSSAATSKNQTMDAASRTISEAKKAFDDADTDYYEKLDEYNSAWNKASEYATSTDAIESDPTVSAAKAALDAATEVWYVKQYAYDQATSSYSDTAATAANSYQSVKDSADMTEISNSPSYSATATQLADLYEMKGDTVIIAQTSGIVTSISAVEGAVPTGALMTIQDDEKLEINVDIKEKDIFSVKEGMNVELSSSSLENVTGKGVVSKVNLFATAGAPTANGVAGDNTFGAKISVTENNNILLGMKLKGRISTGEELNVNAVPYTAILSDAEGDYVYIAEEVSNGMYTVTRKYVEKGMSGDYYTEITDTDLEEGDKVICYPNTVTENGIITITE